MKVPSGVSNKNRERRMGIMGMLFWMRCCLDNLEKFLYRGGWSMIISFGSIILDVAIYLYEEGHLLNKDWV